MEPKQRYQEAVLFLSNADEKFDHICCTYTHGTYQRIRSGFFLYMESMPNSMACGNGCAADSSSELASASCGWVSVPALAVSS